MHLRKKLQGPGYLEQQQRLSCKSLLHFTFFCCSSLVVLLVLTMATPTDADGPSTSAQFAQLLDAIRGVEANVDSKLSDMRREMRDEREAADERLVKKIRLDSRPTFRKRGHEKQFMFNEQVREKFESVDSALQQTPPAIEKARAAIQEGEKLIDARQKHIKIADRSEHGWATVAEYEEDELADNSDDEKRLFRAEARAGRKRQKSVKEAKKKGGSKKPFRAPHVPVGGEPVHSGAATMLHNTNLLTQLFGPKHNVNPHSNTSQLGPCWLCGKTGHFRKFCPLLQPAAARATQ